jgi:hypothetical protein
MRSKKSMRKKSSRVKKFARDARASRARVIFLAVLCLLAAAALIAARRTVGPPEVATASGRPENLTAHAQTTAPAAPTPSLETATKTSSQKPLPVTITGCLELDEETFWLRDTTGPDAPMSRSWKSAFLKKRSASIEVVDAVNSLKLPKHVGQRVTVTGLLAHREMQVRSLQRVAVSCNSKPGLKV